MTSASGVAKCLTSVVSLGCFTAGIVLLEFSSEQEHEHKAVSLLKSIEEWKRHRQDFDHLKASGSFGVGSATSSFSVASLGDRDRFINAEDLPEYEELAYKLKLVPGILPKLKFGQIEWEESVPQEYSGLMGRFYLLADGTNLSTGEFPLLKALTRREQQGLYNNCKRHKGTYDNGHCWTYSRLSRICLQIERVGTKWRLAPKSAGMDDSYGCEFHGGNWTFAEYKEVDLVPIDPSGQIIEFKDLDVVVRYVYDPLIKALEVTDGTLDFGMTAEEERWLSFVLMIMSLLLAVPPCCAVANWWLKKRAKERERNTFTVRAKRRKPNPEMVGMKYAIGCEEEEYDIR